MRRIVVVETRTLFSAGIKRLLTDAGDLEVIGLVAGDYVELAEEIGRIQPDVAVLVGKGQVPADASQLATFLNVCPNMRVMIVSEVVNEIHIYDKQQMVVTETADLLDLIRGR